MNEKTTKTIVTGVSILLLTAGVFFISRAILKNIQARKEDEIAGSGEGNEEGSGDTLLTPSEEAEAKNYNPTADVNYIYSKIAGWNYYTYGKEVNQRVMSLTDAKLKKMAQAYKRKNGGVSLFVALEDEWGNEYEPSQNRLAQLNLK
jgi:hypothetical protein